MLYEPAMKSATIPPLRVTPELRHDAESVLIEGESLSSFVEEALRRQVEHRRTQKEFIARGLASREAATSSGEYASKEEVMGSLRAIVRAAK
jgi:predicted transcriptional regulator